MGFLKNKKDKENVKTISLKIDAERSKNDANLDRINLKKVILIVTLGYVAFTSYSCYSLPAPFLPREAEKKGLTPTQYGIIFASYEIVRLVMSPICSAISLKMTPKVFLITGIFIKSFCTPLFGLCAYAKTPNTFYICSLIVRIVWAIGGSATTTGCYLVGTIGFPKHISVVFASLEMGVGLGQTAGPGIGGFLYEIGGYSFPFYAMGLICAISMIPCYYLIEGDCRPVPIEEKVEKTTIWQTIKIEGVYMNLIASAAVCIICGFNEVTLDIHVREVGDYSASQTGLVFLLSALVYAMSCQFVGFLAKTTEKSYKFILLGCFLCLISCVIIGPIPLPELLQINPSIYYILISQIVSGIGFGFVFVLSFDDTVKEAIKYLPNNDSTMAAISGLFTSSFALGNVIGPIAGGWLVENYGYRFSTVPNCIMMILLMILLIIYMIRNKKF